MSNLKDFHFEVKPYRWKVAGMLIFSLVMIPLGFYSLFWERDIVTGGIVLAGGCFFSLVMILSILTPVFIRINGDLIEWGASGRVSVQCAPMELSDIFFYKGKQGLSQYNLTLRAKNETIMMQSGDKNFKKLAQYVIYLDENELLRPKVLSVESKEELRIYREKYLK